METDLEHQGLSRRDTKEYVLVTGPTSGVGKSICLALAHRKSNLVLVARNQEKLDELQEELKPSGISTMIIKCDLSDYASVTTACEQIISRHVHLAGIISNAGESLPGLFGDFSHEAIQNHIQACVGSPSIMLNSLWKLLTKKSYIVVLGSTCSLSAGYGTSNNSVYSASKAYLRYLSESIRKERGKNVPRLLVVHPGTVNSSFHQSSGFNPSKQKWPRVISSEEAAMKIISLIDDERAGEVVLGLDNRAAILLWRLGIKKTLLLFKGIKNALQR
ncbi:SDR family NAD(P)-dependent oxidoreductase [Synechococcus sp. W4D4]|uniref:SDR family NAD(P)-dependent oxidoreductase n=1 Tax=Synechococcus sp. W4D4 TaxID=3392294 RepID=UPI0039EA3BD7